jgi:hypothetical protein
MKLIILKNLLILKKKTEYNQTLKRLMGFFSKSNFLRDLNNRIPVIGKSAKAAGGGLKKSVKKTIRRNIKRTIKKSKKE